MSKIDDLIKELCPDGVDVWSLGDLEDSGKIKLGRGMVISKNDIADNPGDYPVYSSSATGLGEFGRYSKYMFDDERITWSVDGGGRFFHRKAHKYSVTNVSGWIKVNDANIITKYLYYALDNLWLTKKFDYIKKAHPSVIRNEYNIPIPPLEVQKEIVRVLDSFTELEAELEAELEVELEARKKQYEYYRNTLLTFNERERVIWKSMGEIGKISMCKRIMKSQTSRSGDIPFYKIGTFGKTADAYISRELYSDYKSNFPFPKKGDILLSASGTIGRTVVYDGKPAYFQDSNIIWLENDESQVTNKFLYHLYKITTWQTEGGTIKRLYIDNFKRAKIPVPPLEKQKQIVSILDKFEKLTNDISIGLPAEIEARRKQYEYYRNKLLTFKELECSR